MYGYTQLPYITAIYVLLHQINSNHVLGPKRHKIRIDHFRCLRCTLYPVIEEDPSEAGAVQESTARPEH